MRIRPLPRPSKTTFVTRTIQEGTRVTRLADHPNYIAPAQRLPRGIRWMDLVDGHMGKK